MGLLYIYIYIHMYACRLQVLMLVLRLVFPSVWTFWRAAWWNIVSPWLVAIRHAGGSLKRGSNDRRIFACGTTVALRMSDVPCVCVCRHSGNGTHRWRWYEEVAMAFREYFSFHFCANTSTGFVLRLILFV
jgi:hypothetical protein